LGVAVPPGEPYKTFDLPYAPNVCRRMADHIVKDGRRIGISSGTIYSYQLPRSALDGLDRPGRNYGNQDWICRLTWTVSANVLLEDGSTCSKGATVSTS
jgi:hypothetical protein